jgi:hypothetical protein
MGLTHATMLVRMEASGEMARRRELLHAWFAQHPEGTADQAVAAFPEFTLRDHMRVLADSLWQDLRADTGSEGTPGRLHAFRQAYPQISIGKDAAGWWTARVHDQTLNGLLDQLAALLPSDGLWQQHDASSQ